MGASSPARPVPSPGGPPTVHGMNRGGLCPVSRHSGWQNLAPWFARSIRLKLRRPSTPFQSCYPPHWILPRPRRLWTSWSCSTRLDLPTNSDQGTPRLASEWHRETDQTGTGHIAPGDPSRPTLPPVPGGCAGVARQCARLPSISPSFPLLAMASVTGQSPGILCWLAARPPARPLVHLPTR